MRAAKKLMWFADGCGMWEKEKRFSSKYLEEWSCLLRCEKSMSRAGLEKNITLVIVMLSLRCLLDL